MWLLNLELKEVRGSPMHLQAHVPSALPMPHQCLQVACNPSKHLDRVWQLEMLTQDWEDFKSQSGDPWIKTFKDD